MQKNLLQTMQYLSLFLISGMLLLACGFKLKQPYNFDSALQSIELEYKSIDPVFLNTLRNALNAQGIEIKNNASTKLNILSYKTQKQAASINSNNARQTETRLTHSLSFSLSQAGKVLIEPSTLRRSREYINDNTNISGKVEEERFLSTALDKELIDLLLLQLANYQSPLNDTDSGN